MNRTTKLMLLAISTLFLSFSFISQGVAEELTPRQIAQLVEDRNDGDTSISEMTMILVDARKNQRIRKLKAFSKDYGKDKKTINFFLSPADVKNTTFLSYDWDDKSKEDDNWLYLPALRKVKRIATSNKKDSFMGSDFSYVDMNGLEIDDWNYKLLQNNKKVDGHDTWVLEATPKNKEVIKITGYLKRIAWIRKDIHMPVRSKVWVKKGKKIKFFQASDIVQINGIWKAKKLEMTTKRRGRREHSTILLFDNIQINQAVDDNLFTTQRMERGL